MVTRIGGFRRKTRHKLSKNFRRRGKISLTKYFAEFDEGQKVQLVAEPAIQKGMYFPRFHGKVGIVCGKQGNCYQVEISDIGAKKTLVVHPVHLKKV